MSMAVVLDSSSLGPNPFKPYFLMVVALFHFTLAEWRSSRAIPDLDRQFVCQEKYKFAGAIASPSCASDGKPASVRSFHQ